MQHILVGVDGSDHAMKAVEQAAVIATACKADLHLLAVVAPIASVWETLEAYQHAEHLSDELPRLLNLVEPDFLATAVARARAMGATKVSTQLTAGDPAAEILAAAQELNIDLIVVGSRGRGRFSSLLLGSISQKLAVHATCSVLIVH